MGTTLMFIGCWYFFPSFLLGPFLTYHNGNGWVDPNGEIYVEVERTVNRAALPGTYFVKVDRLAPDPQTIICNHDGRAPYRPDDDGARSSITLDLGYYMGGTPGSGQKLCENAYKADVISIRTVWCERHAAGICIGEINPDVPIIIDLKEWREKQGLDR